MQLNPRQFTRHDGVATTASCIQSHHLRAMRACLQLVAKGAASSSTGKSVVQRYGRWTPRISSRPPHSAAGYLHGRWLRVCTAVGDAQPYGRPDNLSKQQLLQAANKLEAKIKEYDDRCASGRGSYSLGLVTSDHR